MDSTTAPQVEAPQPAPPPAPAPRRPAFGEFAPAFACASDVNPRFLFRSLGGRWMILFFFASLRHEATRAAHDLILARRDLFDDQRAQFFGVSTDPADRSERGLKNSLPGVRYFWDFDQAVTRQYGVAIEGGFQPTAFLIDPNLRIAGAETVSRTGALLDKLEEILKSEEPLPDYGAPILTLPRILEPEFCQALIAHYEQHGGQASGFMREIDGKTVPMMDGGTKKRRDHHISDPALIDGLRGRITHRLIPAIQQAFFWRATRIERFIVSCYSSEDRGFFAPHRDNTTPGTAHRRFAVTINLNDAFDGGELRFPEYGRRTYRPPLGGATVFNCSILHEATPVTAGIRYATLPFLYDEAGRATRDANMHSVVAGYQAASPGEAAGLGTDGEG